MKKKNVIKTGALVGSLLMSSSLLSACVGPVENVYGPPPEKDEPGNGFRVEDNMEKTLYGPPEFFDPDYDPANNFPEDVYGPPPEPDFDPEDELPQPEYGPPELSEEEYDPENNFLEDVYGPPPEPESGLIDVLPQTVYGPPVDEPAPDETEEQP
ncbi:MAG: hypothetical protein K6G17_00020 [Oscillospiraceae bacterium]|nr:hypothetical protein [Oscillospiraceae bacterium]